MWRAVPSTHGCVKPPTDVCAPAGRRLTHTMSGRHREPNPTDALESPRAGIRERRPVQRTRNRRGRGGSGCRDRGRADVRRTGGQGAPRGEPAQTEPWTRGTPQSTGEEGCPRRAHGVSVCARTVEKHVAVRWTAGERALSACGDWVRGCADGQRGERRTQAERSARPARAMHSYASSS